MKALTDKFFFLKSRKFWACVVGWLTLLSASIAAICLDPEVCQPVVRFPWQDFTTKTLALVIGYIMTVAWEDTARVNAASKPATVAITPSTVTGLEITSTE